MRAHSATSENSVFLATTALEDFWDVSKPVLFLSEGCRRYSRRSVWEAVDGRVLATPWHSEQEVSDAHNFVVDVHKRLLPQLAQALNSAHGRSHDLRYWRIVLGPWLTRYLSTVYDRYRLIRSALAAEPNLTTMGLAESCFVTPHDTSDFTLRILDDPYNLQICTKIMAALGMDFPRKEMKADPAGTADLPLTSEDPNLSLKARLKDIARNLYQHILEATHKGRPILLKNAYFSRRVQAFLVMRTLGRVWINETPPLPYASAAAPLDKKIRGGLMGAPAADEFGRVLSRLLPEDLPRCFAEDYGRVEAYAHAHYPPAPRAIFSANAWYYDEAFKHWAGACAEKGTQLLGTQHGGCGYGIQRYMIHEAHELEITDRYYTWGWERAGTRAATIALPAAKLMGRKVFRPDNKRSGLLFVMTVVPRFLLDIPYSPDMYHDYLLQQKLFVESLDARLRGELRVRPHYSELGWDVAQRWRDNFPDVVLESWDKTFRDSLADCRLFVTDHISTTYLESLAAGKPTIVFWKPDSSINLLRADAQEYFDGLRAVGILHDTPQSAAQAVGQAYEDVEAWWNEPRRQAALARFRHRYARTSGNAMSIWTEELVRVADASQG
ncbi:MAG: LIC12162 family transferase [Elusimicrobiota bacterium]